MLTIRTLKTEYFSKLEKYINEYQQKCGYSPSINDMVGDLGIPKTTVHRYLTHMKESGMLDINGRGKIATKDMAKTKRSTIRLPVLGAVSCGIPKYAEENIEEYVQIVVALIENEDATLKRYCPKEDGQHIDLVPENDSFKVRTVDLSCESMIIQGVAVKVLKDLE